ncbi:MAG: type II methionyl aminopeptidase [Candidatus Methanomethylophilus sp.]|jgi:methionyl aminopeptidase|nr:type II methionyl aminopeptidase [Methanomethylophilus sp.]
MLNEDQLAKLRKAGEVSAAARDLGISLCKPGAKLFDIAQEVEGYIRDHGCGVAFPCNLSINEVAAHYTPTPNDQTRLEIGDVIKVDCGAVLDGYIGDTAATVEVATNAYRDLVEASKRARNTVAEFVGEGTPIREIGRAIEMSVKRDGFNVVENLCGHQIDFWDLHAGYSIPPYDAGDETKIQAGQTFAVEPFATNGKGYVNNGKPGNIVIKVRDKPVSDPELKDFIAFIDQEFHGLPFCARSCDRSRGDWQLNDSTDPEKCVKKLVRMGILSSFAQLVEVPGAIVTQHEYTFYAIGKRAEVTTLP